MVVAKAAKKFVLIAGKCLLRIMICLWYTIWTRRIVDYRKKSDSLGVQWTKGVPIEVVPLAYKVVINNLNSKLSIKPQTVKLRMVQYQLSIGMESEFKH
jgi:ribose 5-phosphate isomerase